MFLSMTDIYFSCFNQFNLMRNCVFCSCDTHARATVWTPSFHLTDWQGWGCSRKYLSCFRRGLCMRVTCCVSSVSVSTVKRGWLNGQGLGASSLWELHGGDTCEQGYADAYVAARHMLLYTHSTWRRNCGWESGNINEAFTLGCTE